MSGRLEGKVRVVTGTGGSMGRATALTFAHEGASVVGCDVIVDPAVRPSRWCTPRVVRWCRCSRAGSRPDRLRQARRAGRERVRPDRRAVQPRRQVPLQPAGKLHRRGVGRRRRDEVDLVFYLTRAAWPHLGASHGVVVNMAS